MFGALSLATQHEKGFPLAGRIGFNKFGANVGHARCPVMFRNSQNLERKLFSEKASGAARACLYLAPEKFDLVEDYQIMEGMGTLRLAVVQQLLEQCNSIKVKRLPLYFIWPRRLGMLG
jgi:hypothetical protein